MPLLTRNTIPPGGWIYEQQDSHGKLLKKFKSMSPFSHIVKDVLAFRRLNKLAGADLDTVSSEVDEAQCERLGYNPRYCQKKNYLHNPTKLFKSALNHIVEVAGVVAGRAGNLKSGAGILGEWLGDGAKPVTWPEAQHRADICLGKEQPGSCPYNCEGFKPVESIAEIVKAQVEKKNELELAVEGEERLHTCSVCWCHLPLKVWVPMAYILENTPAPMIEKFKEEAPWCWMLNEKKENPQNEN